MINYHKIRILFSFICLLFLPSVIIAQTQESVKSEIYSKITCCPCKDKLETCVCPEAKEIKAYIDALLESGVQEEEIFYKVAKKFSLKVISDETIKNSIEKRLLGEAGNSRPQINVSPVSFSFGKVSRTQGKISKIFELSNKGNSDLVIPDIRTSCPCAFVSLKIGKNKSPYFGTEGNPKDLKFKIKPGQSAKLEIIIDLNSPSIKLGKATRAAFIKSNDPIYPDTTVMVELELKD